MTENQLRIMRGRAAIATYADSNADEDVRTNAVDLIADVLHAIRAIGDEPEPAHAIAWRHYVAERDEDV